MMRAKIHPKRRFRASKRRGRGRWDKDGKSRDANDIIRIYTFKLHVVTKVPSKRFEATAHCRLDLFPDNVDVWAVSTIGFFAFQLFADLSSARRLLIAASTIFYPKVAMPALPSDSRPTSPAAKPTLDRRTKSPGNVCQP